VDGHGFDHRAGAANISNNTLKQNTIQTILHLKTPLAEDLQFPMWLTGATDIDVSAD
jgi:hypothetical protein